MIVLYRVSPYKSSNPSPYMAEDKFDQVIMSFNSLVGAFGNNRPERFYFISDGAEEWKSNFISRLGGVEAHWINSAHGNFQSYKQQLSIAETFEDKVILLCEDDYLWRPNVFQHLELAAETLGLTFPYDHPGHYIEERFGRFKQMTLLNGLTYRKCLSNTLTFAATSEFIKTYMDILSNHGTMDHEMFSLISETEDMWCPTHSFATHLVTGLLAPNVQWDEIAKVYSQDLK